MDFREFVIKYVQACNELDKKGKVKKADALWLDFLKYAQEVSKSLIDAIDTPNPLLSELDPNFAQDWKEGAFPSFEKRHTEISEKDIDNFDYESENPQLTSDFNISNPEDFSDHELSSMKNGYEAWKAAFYALATRPVFSGGGDERFTVLDVANGKINYAFDILKRENKMSDMDYNFATRLVILMNYEFQDYLEARKKFEIGAQLDRYEPIAIFESFKEIYERILDYVNGIHQAVSQA